MYPTRCNVTEFILSGNCSTCFGWYLHPSSGAHTTVSTAYGICHTDTLYLLSLNLQLMKRGWGQKWASVTKYVKRNENRNMIRAFQYISNKMQRYTVYFIWKLLCMFRVVPPPIIRSAYNCIYNIWYLSHRQIPDAVDTVVCAPDDGWWCHPKHAEQFPDKINCVTLHLVGYILNALIIFLFSLRLINRFRNTSPFLPPTALHELQIKREKIKSVCVTKYQML